MKKIRIGLDLDGVILYNPARIMRPIIKLVKSIFFKKRLSTFYIPKSDFEKKMWYIFHKSSIFVAPGMDLVKKHAKNKNIEFYVITGRFDYLKEDLYKWIDKIHGRKFLKGIFHNKDDEQPHIFKERMLKKLKLDYFVEDNLNIVDHLHRNTKTRIFWIYNIFDKRVKYQYKHPTLKSAILAIFDKKS